MSSPWKTTMAVEPTKTRYLSDDAALNKRYLWGFIGLGVLIGILSIGNLLKDHTPRQLTLPEKIAKATYEQQGCDPYLDNISGPTRGAEGIYFIGCTDRTHGSWNYMAVVGPIAADGKRQIEVSRVYPWNGRR